MGYNVGKHFGKPSVQGVKNALSKAGNDTTSAVRTATGQAKDAGGKVLNPVIAKIAPKGGTTKTVLGKINEAGRHVNTKALEGAKSTETFVINAVTPSKKHSHQGPEWDDMSPEERQAAIDKVKGVKGGNSVTPTPNAAPPTPKYVPPISMVDNPTFDPRFKNAQTSLLTQLQDRAAGRGGPSLAEMQQKQAGNKAMQNTLGAVRAGTGSNAALAARTAALAGGNQMANLANESAMMRMREQQDAQSQIAGLAAQGRQGGATEAGMSMDAQRLNQASDLSQRGMVNEMDRAKLASDTTLGTAAIDAMGRVDAAKAGKPEESPWYNSLIPVLAQAGIAAANKSGTGATAQTKQGNNTPYQGQNPGTPGEGVTQAPSGNDSIFTPQQAPTPQGVQAGPYDDSSQNTMSVVAPAAAPARAPIRMPPPVAPVGKRYTVKPQAPAPLPPQTPIMAAAARTPPARSVGRRAF
jgi:hypothetical protein